MILQKKINLKIPDIVGVIFLLFPIFYYSDEYIKGGSKNRIRRITPYEALLIQGFKKNTSKRIVNTGLSDTQLYKLAGNAVSPAVVKEVMRHLLNFKS